VPCDATRGGPSLEVVELSRGAVAGVAIRGEIDLATAPSMTEAVDRAIRESSGPFVMDLSAVGFMDSTGIQALLRARALLGREERPLVLGCPSDPVRRVLAIAGIEDLFVLHDSPDPG
jgi:anti-sigma B factor antagonist